MHDNFIWNEAYAYCAAQQLHNPRGLPTRNEYFMSTWKHSQMCITALFIILETLPISFNLWIHEKCGYPYGGILLSSDQKQSTGEGNSVDKVEMH